MVEKARFSKGRLLEVLDERVARIAKEQRFDLSNGTAQLTPKFVSEPECSRIERAVQYGRMIAFKQLAETVEEGFRFEA